MAFVVPINSPSVHRATGCLIPTKTSRPAFSIARFTLQASDSSGTGTTTETATEDKVKPRGSHAPPAPLTDCIGDVEEPQPPGYADDSYFGINDSVQFWRSYNSMPESSGLMEHVRQITSFITTNPTNARYWFHTLSRFAVLLTARNGLMFLQTNADADTKVIPQSSSTRTKITGALQIVDFALYTLRQDYENIVKGSYKLPWDLTFEHSSQNAFSVLKLLETLSRMFQRQHYNMIRKEPDISVWLDGPFFPQYYKQTYHFQADGWMSSDSADIYDIQTELFFTSLQDAMERTAFCAMAPYIRDVKPEQKLQIVEVAAGTGRFATFTRDNWPLADYVISDLSPFYLEKARENMNYWERTQGRKYNNLGSVRYVHAPGENLPLENASVDILYSVYVFHELPPQARRAVIEEAARVLKPGGLFVLTDSVQRGDRILPSFDIASFGGFNEPWYKTYIDENFGEVVCSRSNFEPYLKNQNNLTKTLSFKRTKA